MSLLTRCPACDTLYRVVPDQLRISEGWVKCGQCGDIFDASKQLVEMAIADALQSEESPLAPVTGEPSHSQPLPTSLDAEDAAETLTSLASPIVSTDGLLEVERQGPMVEGATEFGVDSVPVIVATESDLEHESCTPQEPIQVRWDDPPPAQTFSEAAETEKSNDQEPVTFLTKGDAENAGQKPYLHVVLWLLAVMLGFFLLGQWVVVERNQLAARYPEFKSVLKAVCDLASCQIQALKRIESMSVDSVGFRQLDKETYRLSFVVKNASPLNLALPSVELVLTDEQDRPVYRRVFSVEELGTMNTVIAANSEWSSSVVLHVVSPTSHERVLGYRLLIFYP